MKCFFCGQDIIQYDDIQNSIRVPSNISLFTNIVFDSVPCCLVCRNRFQKIKAVIEYLIIKIIKLFYKIYHKIKNKSNNEV